MGLQVSLADFSKKVAVTAEVHHDSATPLTSPSGIRVNKRRLLEYLAADVNVQWDAAVTNVSSTNEGLFIEVKDKHATAKEPVTVEGAGIVGADGVHSAGGPIFWENLARANPAVICSSGGGTTQCEAKCPSVRCY